MTRFLLAFGLLLMLTSADAGLAGIFGIHTAAPFLLLPVTAFALALVLLERQNGALGEATVVSIEIVASLIVLYAPVFIGLYWIEATPSSIYDLGWLPFANILAAVLIFQIAIYFDSNELQWIARGCLLFYGASVVGDLLSSGLLFSALVARPAGFLGNPNDGSAQLIALLVPSLDWRGARLSGLFWCLVALVFMAMTLSRSGLLAWALVTFTFGVHSFMRSTMRARVFFVSVFALLVAGFAAITSSGIGLESLPVTNGDSLQRVSDIADLVGGNASEISEDPRYATYKYWSDVGLENPLIGHGSGYSVSGHGTGFLEQYGQGPHNMFIARFVDQGAIGIFAFGSFLLIWIAFFLFRRDLAGVMLVIAFIMISLFSHNSTDRRALLGLFAFCAAMSLQRGQIAQGSVRAI